MNRNYYVCIYSQTRRPTLKWYGCGHQNDAFRHAIFETKVFDIFGYGNVVCVQKSGLQPMFGVACLHIMVHNEITIFLFTGVVYLCMCMYPRSVGPN